MSVLIINTSTASSVSSSRNAMFHRIGPSFNDIINSADPKKTVQETPKDQQNFHEHVKKSDSSNEAKPEEKVVDNRPEAVNAPVESEPAIEVPTNTELPLLDLLLDELMGDEITATILPAQITVQSHEIRNGEEEAVEEAPTIPVNVTPLKDEQPKAVDFQKFTDSEPKFLPSNDIKPEAKEIEQPEAVATVATVSDIPARPPVVLPVDNNEIKAVVAKENSADIPVEAGLDDNILTVAPEVKPLEPKTSNPVKQTPVQEAPRSENNPQPQNINKLDQEELTTEKQPEINAPKIENPLQSQAALQAKLPVDVKIQSVEVIETSVIPAVAANDRPTDNMSFEQNLSDSNEGLPAQEVELDATQIFDTKEEPIQLRSISANAVIKSDKTEYVSANISNQIVEEVGTSGNNLQRLNSEQVLIIKLTPESLGNIEARIERGFDGQLKVTLTVESQDTFDLVARTEKELIAELKTVTKSDDASFSFDLQKGNQGNNGYEKNQHTKFLFEEPPTPTILSQLEKNTFYSSPFSYNGGAVNRLI